MSETHAFLKLVRRGWEEKGVPNVAAVELGLREALARDAARLLEQLYSDPTLPIPGDTARPGEKCHRARGKQVLTLFGWVNLRRNYYYDPGTDESRVPLDQALGLVESYSPAVVRLAARAAARVGYAAAGEDLQELAALPLEGRQIQRLVGACGPDMTRALAQAKETTPPSTLHRPTDIPVMYIEVDGTGVPMVAAELAGRRGKQADGSAKTREVKLASVFTQICTDAEGGPMRDHQSTSYIGGFETAADFGARVRSEAFRRGLGRAQQVVFIGDGAAWIWELQRVNFPDAVAILDRYHALEHLHTLCLGLCGGQGPEALARIKEQWIKLWDEDRIDEMIEAARARRASLGPAHDPDARLAGEIEYFHKHRNRMRYGTYRKLGYFYGSGVVEAGCKSVIGARLKQSGMFWTQTGAENVLALRCALLSHRWEQCWHFLHGTNHLQSIAA